MFARNILVLCTLAGCPPRVEPAWIPVEVHLDGLPAVDGLHLCDAGASGEFATVKVRVDEAGRPFEIVIEGGGRLSEEVRKALVHRMMDARGAGPGELQGELRMLRTRRAEALCAASAGQTW